jgi:hypothetical protein
MVQGKMRVFCSLGVAPAEVLVSVNSLGRVKSGAALAKAFTRAGVLRGLNSGGSGWGVSKGETRKAKVGFSLTAPIRPSLGFRCQTKSYTFLTSQNPSYGMWISLRITWPQAIAVAIIIVIRVIVENRS